MMVMVMTRTTESVKLHLLHDATLALLMSK
jgi:hypothetical protein